MGSGKQKFSSAVQGQSLGKRSGRRCPPEVEAFFVYNCMHFCIGVATGIVFLGKQIQRVPSFLFPFPFSPPLLPFSSFFSFLLSLPFYLALSPFLLPFSLFSLALEPQNSSYRDWGVLWASPAGSGAEPQPKSNFVH